MNVPGQLMSSATGRWRAQGDRLHFRPPDDEPNHHLGVWQAPPPSGTRVVRHFDGRTIEATVGVTRIRHQRMP